MGKDQELLEAARSGNFIIVEKLLTQKAKRSGPLASLRRGPGANVQDASGYSALHHAALNGHKDIVKLLLTNEASTNIVDLKGSSPLHLAAWSGNVDIVRMLLSHGPSIPYVNLVTKDNETALHCAAQYGHTEVVCLLLEHSCDPTIRNSKQETALDLAAQYGRLETVDMLVRTHPELIQPYNGLSSNFIFPHTPLHLASRNGHKPVVEMLLAAGMNVNVRTSSGSALHEAALCGKTEVVRTLLENGIDLNIRDIQNNTVTDLLKQFPCHVVRDIYTLIKSSSCENLNFNSDSASPNSISPMHYDSYDRRLSSSYSVSKFMNYHLPNLSKSLVDTNYLQEDISFSRSQDYDSLSLCSTASSSCSRDRRSPFTNQIIGGQLPSPSSLSYKISPNPPKKPPRRNLSVSPTHTNPITMSLSSENGFDVYDYPFTKSYNNAQNQMEFSDLQVINGKKVRDSILRRGKSAEHYVDTKFRHSVMIDINEKPNVMIRGKSEDFALFDSKFQPVAITSVYDNIPYRITNPRRKLRRNNNGKNYENCDASIILSRGDLPFRKVNWYESKNKSSIKIERILTASVDRYNPNKIKSSQESLLDDLKKPKQPLRNCPLSPTHYQQPPTPDHPPPSAVQAEKRIHDRIRPLSQEYSNLKRKSRDIETETEEELLLLVFPGTIYDTASNGSVSSNISLNDKSVSTDYNTVEEYIGERPFAGLFKGSVTIDLESESHYGKIERPTSLRQLKTVYNSDDFIYNGIDENVKHDYMAGTSPANRSLNTTINSAVTNGATDKSISMSILSPFDEKEEWAKISEIMASFGNDFNRESIVAELEQEFEARLGVSRINNSSEFLVTYGTVNQWLTSIGLSKFESMFVDFGYDDINFINGVINDCDLKEIGIINENNREDLIKQICMLPNRISEFWTLDTDQINEKNQENAVKLWLNSINLGIYFETFYKNLYTDMERVKRIWEVELTAVLEITKPGHRRRILASINAGKLHSSPHIKDSSVSNNLDNIHADLNQLKNNIQELEDEIRIKSDVSSNTQNNIKDTHQLAEGEVLRHNRKKSRPAPPPPPLIDSELNIRNPSELLVGVPSTLKAQWRHKPGLLIIGTVNYTASYLGSTVVKELRGTESTKKSIQKLKKSTSVVDCRVTPEIILAISYRGVKFLNVTDHSLICEHEIRNIHCACQDSEDLTHFAYITKDRVSKTHYCHVFCVQTMDQATEVILTLGEAFEVAYQMALKEHFASNNRGGSHVRPHSANAIACLDVDKSVSQNSSSSRSHSIDGIINSPNSKYKSTHTRSFSVTDVKVLNGNILPKNATSVSPSQTPVTVAEDM